MAAAAVPVVIGVAEEVLDVALKIKSLSNSGDHQELDEIVARLAEISQKLDELKGKLDSIAKAVAGLYVAIDRSREEALRITLWGSAKVALLNIGVWSRDPQSSLKFIIPELNSLLNATQDVIGGGSIIGVPTMGLALAAHVALFEILLKTDQNAMASLMYKVSVTSFQRYFQQSAEAARQIGLQAQATQASSESKLRGYTLTVAPGPNAPPPGPYIPSDPRSWRGNCLEVWHCSGSLASSFTRDSGKTWTRLNSIHTDHDPPACEPNGNELGNDFPLTSLAELNGLCSAYQSASEALQLSGVSEQAATTLLKQTEQLG